MKKTWILWLVIAVLIFSNIYFMSQDAVISFSHKEEENNASINASSGEEIVIDVQKDSGEVVVKEEPKLEDEDKEKEVYKEYDVMVFDAEPEGIVTSISAARNGKKVLLVEKRDGPGGLMTYAMLNTIDMNHNFDKTLLSQGIFEEFYKKIGNKESFDVDTAKKAFEEMLDAEENIEVLYNVKDIKIGSDGTKIEYAIVDGKKYIASMYVDCTQDADITVAAGSEYVRRLGRC